MASRKIIRSLTVLVCAMSLLAVMGCAKKQPSEQAAAPAVKPPVIVQAGKLTIGVSLGNAPYAVKTESGYTGLDVEIGDAMASKLNLEPAYVLVNPDMIAEALADKSVDIVLSAPENGKKYQVIGNYQVRSLARYGQASNDSAESKNPSFPVAVQLNSPAYWYLKQKYGDESYKSFESLAQAIAAVESGELEEVMGDSIVLAYAVNNGAKLAPRGTLGDEAPLGVAVASENSELATVIQSTYDAMKAAGVFDSLKRTWLEAPSSSSEEAPAQ